MVQPRPQPINVIVQEITIQGVLQIKTKCRWKRHLWDHGNPYYGCGVRGREKSRINHQQKHSGRLSRFRPRGCVKPYPCFGGLYIYVLQLAMGREELRILLLVASGLLL